MLAALLAVFAISAIASALVSAMTAKARAPYVVQGAEQRATVHEADNAFVFEVLERVLARTVDGNRYLDALLLGVLASDVALIVLVVEKATAYRDYLLAGTATAAGMVSAALLLSVFVFEAPTPETFLREATSDIGRVRSDYAQQFVIFSQRNDWIRAVKTSIFVFALLILLAAALVATVGAMLESRGNHEAVTTRSPSHLPHPTSGGSRW